VGFFLLPGLALARALNLRCSGEELLALALGVGLAGSNAMFVVAAYAHVPSLYWLLPAGSALYLARRAYVRRGQAKAEASLALSLLLLPVIGVASAMLSYMPVHAVDFTPGAGGGLRLVVPPDGTLHVAIAAELSRAWPPRNPFVGDQMLVYHYSTELAGAVFCKFLGLAPAAVSLRLVPTLFTTLAVLAVSAFVKRLTGSRAVALVTPLFVLLGEDFSFIPGLWKGSNGVWSAQYFSSPSVFGLYFVNPNLPALAAFFCGLVGFNHAFKNGRMRVGWLGVTGALLALAGSYKVFFGIQTLAALGLAALLCSGKRRRFALTLFAATGVGLLLLFAPMLSLRHGPKIIELVPTLFTSYVPTTLASLELADASWLSAITPMFAAKHLTARGAVQLFAVAVPLFVIGTAGVRLLGLPVWLRSVGSRSAPMVLLFVACFALLGYGLGLGLRVTPIDYPDTYNNSVWFLVETKLVSWVFVSVTLSKLFKTWTPPSAAWTATLLVGLLAAPATLNAFKAGSQNGEPALASSDEMAVADDFKRDVTPGAIVLCESANLRRLLLGIAGARVPLAPEFFPVSFLRRQEFDERTNDLASFWQAWADGHYRAELAAKYHVSYVVATRPLPGYVERFHEGALYVYANATLSEVATAH
ncbi:MAG: hypothetical protein ABUL60_33420, partial [Myxococcales bacterium]